MKVTIEIYDRPKYEVGSQVVAEQKYDIKSYVVQEMSDKEIFAEGFDEVDPCGEYLVIRTMDDEFATFRNSFVDMFKF